MNEIELIKKVLDYLADYWDPNIDNKGTAGYLRKLDPNEIWIQISPAPAEEDAIYEQEMDGQ